MSSSQCIPSTMSCRDSEVKPPNPSLCPLGQVSNVFIMISHWSIFCDADLSLVNDPGEVWQDLQEFLSCTVSPSRGGDQPGLLHLSDRAALPGELLLLQGLPGVEAVCAQHSGS